MPKKITNTLEFELYNSFEKLSQQDQELMLGARNACNTAYAPYSNFRVGAALLLANGQMVFGSNQENAAYPSGLCAERVAFFSCSVQQPDERILKVAVTATRAGSGIFLMASPCGGCRQVMLEYEHKQQQPIEIILQWGEQQYIKAGSIAGLLPFSFNMDSLISST
ncbi:cytidine deaminase [Cesiribacter sp. SM1]|uniref:cytidine deaminase n=1 Tax=Cesiribacter sp. SM1 TaxID=2861196 RepID=UPI001CD41DB9|nr:cytidine deaminase [Cesiribacter sp. SM1]